MDEREGKWRVVNVNCGKWGVSEPSALLHFSAGATHNGGKWRVVPHGSRVRWRWMGLQSTARSQSLARCWNWLFWWTSAPRQGGLTLGHRLDFALCQVQGPESQSLCLPRLLFRPYSTILLSAQGTI